MQCLHRRPASTPFKVRHAALGHSRTGRQITLGPLTQFPRSPQPRGKSQDERGILPHGVQDPTARPQRVDFSLLQDSDQSSMGQTPGA